MKKFWVYGLAVVFVSTLVSWGNMFGSPRTAGVARTGSTWSSSTGGGSWGGGGGSHK